MSPNDRQRQKRIDVAFGDWVRQRLAAQKPDRWTQQRLRDELAQRGYEVKREWINQVINGEHASDDLRRAIESVIGTFTEPGGAEPSSDLVEAIRDQTQAMRDLTEALFLLVGLQPDTPEVAEARRVMNEARASGYSVSVSEVLAARDRADKAETAESRHAARASEESGARSVPPERVG